jgi:signal transduction histidine kinase/ligand-binding sensor domain-containing protein
MHGRRLSWRILGLLLPSALFVCPCAVALNPSLYANQYAHTAWKDGFFRSQFSSVAQTPDGYLWLGTEFGLFRFDGVRAVPWQPPPNEHLSSSYIRRLLATRDGTLWIGTLKGLASWRDGKLTQYDELAELYIFSLLEDREGTVWVGAVGVGGPPGKVCAIRHGRVQCDGQDGSLGHGAFNLYEDSKGNLWVGVLDGLWRWRPGPPKFYSLPGEANGIQALAEDTDGSLLAGWKGGIYRFSNGKTEKCALPGAVARFRATRMLRDRDGGLWIGTQTQGLVHVRQGKADVFSLSDGLSGEDIYALFEDREGSIWVATNGGLDRFRDLAVVTIGVKHGLSSANVGSVLAARDGTVWLASYGGLNRWNSGQITPYDRREGKLRGESPNSLFQDGRGRIWVSTNREFGYLENDRFVPITGIPGGVVHGVAEDTAGNLWVANQALGLIQLLPDNRVERISWTKLGHKDFAWSLNADPQGGLWIGFFSSGIEYFKDGRTQASYGNSDGLGEGPVNRFRFDQDGTVWVATQGGLSRLKNGRIATLTSKNGLPCDSVHWVIQDNEHAFWLYMPCGLVRIARAEVDAWAAAFDKEKDTTRTIQASVFGSSDGVVSRAFPQGYSPHVSRTPDGRLWFTTQDGVSVVDPRHLPFNKLPPPVHIEQITADRKAYDAVSQLRLPPRVRDLEIDYTALSLVAPEKIRFRYKLEGRDSDWQDAGNRRQAFYTDLPPRHYRFGVIASNNSGVWNEAGTFLDFAVAPAFYQTTWFRLSCVAALLALLWGLYQLRLQQLAREFNMRLDERVSERTRIARDLHDSLLQGFQGLMFRLQAVRDMLPGRASEAMQALDIALERGDKAIAEGRDTVSDLRQPVMDDGDIAQALTALGEELAEQSDNGTAPCVRVLVEGKQRELNPMLRDEIYRIAREALRNAFRHAKAEKIEAEITYGDSEFLLHVRDNGCGIDPAFANQGSRAGHWGLPGMRERAKSFGGKLEVWSEHGAGTEIELRVPGAIAYSKSEPRRRFWLWRKKTGESDGQ